MRRRDAFELFKASPNELMLQRAGEPARRLTRGMAGLPASALGATRVPAGHPEGYLEAFAQIYRDFAADVRDQQSGRATLARVPGLDDGVRSMEFVEAVLASSHRDSAWVTLC